MSLPTASSRSWHEQKCQDLTGDILDAPEARHRIAFIWLTLGFLITHQTDVVGNLGGGGGSAAGWLGGCRHGTRNAAASPKMGIFHLVAAKKQKVPLRAACLLGKKIPQNGGLVKNTGYSCVLPMWQRDNSPFLPFFNPVFFTLLVQAEFCPVFPWEKALKSQGGFYSAPWGTGYGIPTVTATSRPRAAAK